MIPDDLSSGHPTLGPRVCNWIEKHLVFGPGDLRGEPARLDEEKKALLYRFYEVYPEGHERAGRRRFKRCAVSLRKGSAKTELAAWVAAAELSPSAPVRCIGWKKTGKPIGGPVVDPYIALVAVTEDQTEELVYGALRVVLGLSPIAHEFDIGLERIMRRDGSGKAAALSSSPSARDGARTTLNIMDETHRWTDQRLKRAFRTMLANIPKRRASDAWTLEITTAPSPGDGSVAEETWNYAQAVADGRQKNSSFFFFHRQASDDAPLNSSEEVRAAVIEASGPVATWSDIDAIVEQWYQPGADLSYLRRVWLNQLVRPTDKAFDLGVWQSRAIRRDLPPRGAKIVLGFDGARSDDASSLVGTEVISGHQFRLGLWEKPPNVETWEVPLSEVNAVVEDAFSRWTVVKFYADPPYWETPINEWAGRWGEKIVIKWYTNQWKKMSYTIRAFWNAVLDGSLTHDGDADIGRHIANAYKRPLQMRDDKGAPLWVIQKEAPNSPLKIDGAMASILSEAARIDALGEGHGQPTEESIYNKRAAAGEKEVIRTV